MTYEEAIELISGLKRGYYLRRAARSPAGERWKVAGVIADDAIVVVSRWFAARRRREYEIVQPTALVVGLFWKEQRRRAARAPVKAR